MKKIALLILTSLLSCSNINNKKKSNDVNLVDVESTAKPDIENIITIEYTNKINGYKVTAYWLIEEYANYHDIRYFIGPATLKFTAKGKKTFFIQHPKYSTTIKKENLKYINLETPNDDNFEDEFKGNLSFTQKMEYIYPSTDKVGLYKKENEYEEGYDDGDEEYIYIPFFFQDVTFDEEKEIIITYATLYDKGGSKNKVFGSRYGDEFVEMEDELYSSFSGFYNGYSGFAAYHNTKIDYENKKIIHSGLDGASGYWETIYEFKKDKDSARYEIFRKIEIDNLPDWDIETTKVTLYDFFPRAISINQSKKTIR